MTRHRLRAALLAAFLAVPVLRAATLPAVAQADEPDVPALIAEVALEHGLSPAWMHRIAWCESRFQPWARNRRSGAAGLWQFMPGTWRWMSAQAGLAGSSPYDPWASTEVAAWAFERGYARHWSCR